MRKFLKFIGLALYSDLAAAQSKLDDARKELRYQEPVVIAVPVPEPLVEAAKPIVAKRRAAKKKA